MSDISTPPARGPTPAIGPPAEVKASSSASDNPSTQQQSTKHDGKGSAQPSQPPKTPGHDPAVVLSATLAHLDIGALITATVKGPSQHGAIRLVTPNGLFVAEMTKAPPPGAEITLQIQATQSNVLAAVVAIDGKPEKQPPQIELKLVGLPAHQTPPEPATGSRPASAVDKPAAAPYAPPPSTSAYTPPPAGKPSLPPPDAARVMSGTELIARVMPNPVMTENIAPQPPPSSGLPAGTPLTLSLLTVQSAQANPEAQAPAMTLSTTEATSAPAPSAPLGGSLDGFEVSGVIAHEIKETAAKAASSIADALSRQPAGQVMTKAVLLQTNIGMLQAEVPSSLAVGDQVTTMIVNAAPLDPARAAQPDRPDLPVQAAATEPLAALASLAGQWPAMDAMMAALREAEPAAARAFMATVPSTSGKPLSGSILFFLSALRMGDARGWLGEAATAALSRDGRAELLQRIGQDFKTMERLAGEPIGGEWRPIVLPLHDGQNFSPLILFLRHQHLEGDGSNSGPDQDNDNKPGTRFILELTMTRLGQIQLDGLISQGQFDLIVRSSRALSEELRMGVMNLFNRTNEGAGMTGKIIYETRKPFPVSPLQSLAPDGAGAPSDSRPG
ncbi:MAG: hypothetical protein ACE5EM_02610 [Sphingomonadales bacterium]